MVLSQFLFWLQGYNLGVISYISGILTEELLFLLVILTGDEIKRLALISLFGFFGIMTHDILFYFLFNSSFIGKLKKKFAFSKNNSKLIHSIIKMGRSDYFTTLLLSKFIYGTRIGVILYVSHVEKKLKKFFLLNSLAVLIWFLVMVPVGWLIGEGFSQFFVIIKGLEKLLLGGIILIIIFYAVRLYIGRKLSIKENFS